MAWLGALISAGAGYQASHEAKRQAELDRRSAEAATGAQLELGRDQLEFLQEQDEFRSELGSAWYDTQRGLAEQEDARRFAILPQLQDNAEAAMAEAMTNAGLFYDNVTGLAYDAAGQIFGNAEDLYYEMLGNADQYGGMAMDTARGYQSDIVGNADRMYDELTGNARYSDAEYQDAIGAASADVVQSFDKSRGLARRNMMRYGANPNSSEFARMESESALDQALAEANGMNTTRRSMRSEERSRLNDAILNGLTARASALESGHGAVDSATRYAGGMQRDAITTGRSALDSATRAGAGLQISAEGSGRGALDEAIRYGRGMTDSAFRTNLATSSAQLGLVDPRIGLVTQTGPGYGAVATALGNQASNASASANQNSSNATSAMTAAGQAAGQIAGYYYGRSGADGGGSGGNWSSSGNWYNEDTGMSDLGDNQER